MAAHPSHVGLQRQGDRFWRALVAGCSCPGWRPGQLQYKAAGLQLSRLAAGGSSGGPFGGSSRGSVTGRVGGWVAGTVSRAAGRWAWWRVAAVKGCTDKAMAVQAGGPKLSRRPTPLLWKMKKKVHNHNPQTTNTRRSLHGVSVNWVCVGCLGAVWGLSGWLSAGLLWGQYGGCFWLDFWSDAGFVVDP